MNNNIKQKKDHFMSQFFKSFGVVAILGMALTGCGAKFHPQDYDKSPCACNDIPTFNYEMYPNHPMFGEVNNV